MSHLQTPATKGATVLQTTSFAIQFPFFPRAGSVTEHKDGPVCVYVCACGFMAVSIIYMDTRFVTMWAQLYNSLQVQKFKTAQVNRLF